MYDAWPPVQGATDGACGAAPSSDTAVVLSWHPALQAGTISYAGSAQLCHTVGCRQALSAPWAVQRHVHAEPRPCCSTGCRDDDDDDDACCSGALYAGGGQFTHSAAHHPICRCCLPARCVHSLRQCPHVTQLTTTHHPPAGLIPIYFYQKKHPHNLILLGLWVSCWTQQPA